MSTSIGNITIPGITSSGLTFPLVSDFGYTESKAFPTITHRFGSLATKASQTFQVGFGPTKFFFKRAVLKNSQRKTLADFYEATQGGVQSFIYAAPQPDQTFVNKTVVFESAPISFTDLVNACQVGFNFVEIQGDGTTSGYTTEHTVTRIASGDLLTSLAGDVQVIVPLIRIQPVEPEYPRILVSDREVQIDGDTYHRRVLGIGDPNSDVLLSQSINGQSDSLQLQFGNADRVMTMLSNDTNLQYASVELVLFHVNSLTQIQLWKGFVNTYTSDGSSVFSVQCADGLYRVSQLYPMRTATRTCWKTFDDGQNCKFTSNGHLDTGNFPDASATSCDFSFDGPNGCQAHTMTPSFGGHPAQPQGVSILDDSTGLFGFNRNRVTAVSILSDTVFGQAIPEIFCDDGGNAINSFSTQALMIAYRDESSFSDSIGIVGAGPIGKFAVDDPPTGNAQAGAVVRNADGFPIIIAPKLDGFPAHGFKVDGNGNPTTSSNALGLRQVRGNSPVDPATDSFSLGQGTPQVYGPQMAAGTAFVELRISKPSNIQPSTPDQHVMTVPISKGLSGRIWDSDGTPHWVDGLTNPFWIAVNCYLRAIGLPPQSDDQTPEVVQQLDSFVLSSLMSAPTGDTLTLAVREVDPHDGYLNMWTVDDISDLHLGEVVTITGCSGTGTNLAGPIVKIFPGAGPTGSLIVINNPAAIYSPDYGLGGSAAVAKTFGEGAAQIADEQVDPIVIGILNNTVETQFRFQGKLAQQKPFRDWLQEILSTGLGYFTFESGKLKLGIRSNASAVTTFTTGNMLFQSLSMRPIDAAFEHLVIDFADQDYQFAANTAEYSDKSHADTFGRRGAPLTARVHSVGCSSVSQALRLAAVRTREEIGGVNAVEWRNARMASWGSTILALDTEIGQVVGIEDPMAPAFNAVVSIAGTTATYISGDVFSDSLAGENVLIDGTSYVIDSVADDNTTLTLHAAPGDTDSIPLQIKTAKFRIQSWKLMKDWSVHIEGKTVCASMYDLVVGPKPSDTLPQPLPVLFYPMPLGEWAPYQLQALSTDAAIPDEWTFGLSQQPSGTPGITTISATGKLPVNQFIPNCGPVGITLGKVTYDAAGGTLAGGKTYRVIVCAHNAAGVFSPPSNVLLALTDAGTDTNTFTIHDVQWPKVVGLTDYKVFVSDQDDLIHLVAGGGLTASGSPAYNYTPTNLTVPDMPERDNWRVPDPDVRKVRLKSKSVVHAGVLSGIITGVSGSDIQSDDIIGRIDFVDFASRKFMLIGRDGVVPFLNTGISATDTDTGTITLSQVAVTSSTLSSSINSTITSLTLADASGFPASGQFRIRIGDEILYVTKVVSNTFTIQRGVDGSTAASHSSSAVVLALDHSAQIGDAFVVSFSGYDTSESSFQFGTDGLDLVPHAEIGNVLRVLYGLGRGTTSRINENDAGLLYLDSAVVIDATSTVIVEAAAWDTTSDSSNVANTQAFVASEINLASSSQSGVALIAGFTVDSEGIESQEGDGPMRLVYMPSSNSNTGEPSFDPNRPKYGEIQLQDLDITNPTKQSTAQVHAYYGYVDELKIERFGTLDASMDDTTDPKTVSITMNADGVTKYGAFAVGDFVLFNHTANYEVAQITAISGTDYTFIRHNDIDSDAGNAFFGSPRAAHASGCEVYKVDVKHDSIISKSTITLPGSLATAIATVPNDLTTVLPNACVIGVQATTVSNGVQNSDWTIQSFNNPGTFEIDLNLPNMPGIRTHAGGSYLLPPCSGNVSIGFESLPVSLQDWASLRCVYAEVATAPTGSGIEIHVQVKYPDLSGWSALATLTIGDGHKQSFDPTADKKPTERNHPYGAGWPVYSDVKRPLEGGILLKYVVTGVGSTVPGAGLTVSVQT